MPNKMLIDAAHPEETRVVVLRGNRIEEFDFEAADKKQLRGNIYLAKVTRVEPSLQAAFIEYGGNRHGFLAFSEIHPDYYQIPVADRQALLEEEARSQEDDEDESKSSGHRRSRRHRRGGQPQSGRRTNGDEGGQERNGAGDESEQAGSAPFADEAPQDGVDELVALSDAAQEPSFNDVEPVDEAVVEAAAESTGELPAQEAAPDEASAIPLRAETHPAEAESVSEAVPTGDDTVSDESASTDDHSADHARDDVTTLEHGYEAPLEHDSRPAHDDGDRDAASNGDGEDDTVEQLGGDALEDVPRRVTRPRRNYKIQEVIKRRQVLLVQVVKEERGNKGAALTTYLSLAGRYSVLMPNTARGGGISRKITDAEDRKRLKAIAQELEVPDGMGIILRTAGAARGIAEVKRDFEYLLRMWETVRETTLQSSAPTLVYEEGSLIKRSIRDLYSKDVEEVVVAGAEGYKEARDFMRLLMPSHTRNVVAYRDPQPIFAKSGVEAQLDAMFSNQVVLRSGGYLVINQTEALVAIDVNSGRSTREHNIEDTALRTNLEAADEIARQLRLRDLAGLIVIDFIDMEEGRNDRAVERRIKDALKNDRARIQIGRISHFGLLEMSRQRMRTGVLEGSTVLCAHCGGAGTVRSVSSIALHVLRLLEDTLIKSASHNLSVRTRPEVAIYILNQKRSNLLDLEARFGVTISVFADATMSGTVYHVIERGSEATPPLMLPFRQEGGQTAVLPDDAEADEVESLELDDVEDESVAEERSAPVQAREGHPGGRDRGEGEGEGGRRRKRRRRRRGRDNTFEPGSDGQQPAGTAGEVTFQDEPDGEDEAMSASTETWSGETATDPDANATSDTARLDEPDVEAPVTQALDVEEEPVSAIEALAEEAAPESEAVAEEAPPRRRSRRAPRAAAAVPETADILGEAPEETAAPVRRPRRSRARTAEATADVVSSRPSADRDVGADTAKQHPQDSLPLGQEPELPLAPASVPPVTTEPAAALPQAVAPDTPAPDAAPQASEGLAATAEPASDRPKRSGWWQRAKATFTTGS